MPYTIRGKCIYKKDGGTKVGCTKGNVHRYMAALHANANESVEPEEDLNEIRKIIRQTLSEMVMTEKKEKKLDVGDEIHLPELSMKKKDLLKYLKDMYDIKLKD